MSNYKNLASTVLGNSGQTTDTSIVIPSTTAAIFPTPPFYATIMPTNVGLVNSSNSEIVEVTASTTSGSDTTFTVSRAQRGTSAISWNAHEAILTHAIYTQDMPFIDDVLSTPSSVAYVATDNIQTSAVTTPKIADGAVTSDKIDWTTSPILLGSAQFTSDQSGNEVDIIQRNVTNTTTVRMIFIGSATIKTSTNTSALRIYVDGATLGEVGEGNTGTTNSTTPSTQTVMGYITLSPGTHTVKMTAKAQDGNTTATVASYRRSFLVGWCA